MDIVCQLGDNRAQNCYLWRINRIYHRSPMQTEKSQPEGKRMTPETRFTEFPALSVDPRVGIPLSVPEIDNWLSLLPIL